jgi:hypothetical protein
MHRAHSIYAGVLFVRLKRGFGGCGWKLKRTSDSTWALVLVRPVTGVRRRSRDAVGWEGLKWVWLWVGFDDGCGIRQPISIR